MNDLADAMLLQQSSKSARDVERMLVFFIQKPSIKIITRKSLHSFDQRISNQRFFLEKDKSLK